MSKARRSVVPLPSTRNLDVQTLGPHPGAAVSESLEVGPAACVSPPGSVDVGFSLKQLACGVIPTFKEFIVTY